MVKKQGRYREIQNLVRACSRAEIEYLLKFIKSQSHHAFSAHAERFIQLLADNPDMEEEEAFKTIEFDELAEQRTSSFTGYVRNILLESLLLESNMERPGMYNNRFRNKIATEKKLMQAQLLMGRGLFPEASRLLDEVISKAEKYEYFGFLRTGYFLKTLLSAEAPSQRKIDSYLAELEHAGELRNQQEKSAQHFLSAKLKIMLNEDDSVNDIANELGKLSHIHSAYPTGLGKYHVLNLEIDLKIEAKAYGEAEELIQSTLKLIRNDSTLYSQEREADLNLMLSEVLAEQGKMSQCREVLNTTSSLIKKSSTDYYIVSKRLIFLDFYQKKLGALMPRIRYLIQSKYMRRLPFAEAQLVFFKAVLEFVQDKPANCCKILIEEIQLEQDVSKDLLLGQAIFLFMAGVDTLDTNRTLGMDAFNTVQSVLERLSKIVSYKRNRTILQILKKLLSGSSSITNSMLTHESTIRRLANEDEQMRWQPFSFEIFPLQDWFEVKLNDANRQAQASASNTVD